jgi:predicted HicB family RNase H-like nuclease
MAARRKKKSSNKSARKTKSARLNLLIHPDLKEWAHNYAQERGKSVSSLINEFLIGLREQDRVEKIRGFEAKQI